MPRQMQHLPHLHINSKFWDTKKKSVFRSIEVFRMNGKEKKRKAYKRIHAYTYKPNQQLNKSIN